MRLLRTVSRKGTNLFLKQDEDNPSGNDQNPYYNQHNPQRLKPPCSSMFVGVSLLLEVVSGLLALSLGWVGTLDSGCVASEASEETGASEETSSGSEEASA